MDEHLSQISTVWSMLFQAQRQETGATAAQQKLLVRYCRPIYGYLVHIVKDPNVADDLAQEFATRFVEGKFHKANPERGRFRDYVKACLFNLVREHHRRQQREPAAISAEIEAGNVEDEKTFVAGWGEEMLNQAWDALSEHEQQTGQIYFSVLKQRTQNPNQSSAEMAECLSASLNKKFTAAGIRQLVHRARDKFTDLLLDEVARSLNTEDLNEVEAELIDLNLYSYCKDALKRRRDGN